MHTAIDALTVSASSDYLRCAIANRQAANTINTIQYLFVGLYSVHWHFRHLQIPVGNRVSVNLLSIQSDRIKTALNSVVYWFVISFTRRWLKYHILRFPSKSPVAMCLCWREVAPNVPHFMGLGFST